MYNKQRATKKAQTITQKECPSTAMTAIMTNWLSTSPMPTSLPSQKWKSRKMPLAKLAIPNYKELAGLLTCKSKWAQSGSSTKGFGTGPN